MLRTPQDPIGDLRSIVGGMNPVDAPELGALWSGAFGFFAYDVVRHIERLPHPPRRALDYPDACFVFTDALVVIDNWRGQARVIVSVPVAAGSSEATLDAQYTAAIATLDETIARLQGPESLPPLTLNERAAPAVATSTYPRDAFLRDVERIKEYILAGDVFQALLARRMEVPLDFDTTTLYRALRALNPSPYMYHLYLDGLELVGSSPEMLVRVADGRLTVRPIAERVRGGRRLQKTMRWRPSSWLTRKSVPNTSCSWISAATMWVVLPNTGPWRSRISWSSNAIRTCFIS